MGDNHLDSVELGHTSDSPINNAQSLCEWKFVMEAFDNIKITIKKNPANYENLYIYGMTLNGSKYLYLDDLSIWEDDNIEIEFKKIKYLSIRTDKLSSTSSYSILVERVYVSEDIMTSIFVSIILGIVMFIFATVTFILLFLSCKQWLRERRMRIESQNARRRFADNKIQWIDDTMASMTHGVYINLVQKFKQENWVICLEDFQNDSEIWITKECSHTFHSSCLREWYMTIQADNELSCPHCKTINEPTKERRKSIDGVDNSSEDSTGGNIARVDAQNSRLRMENELRVEQM